jgi:hypothetical protein
MSELATTETKMPRRRRSRDGRVNRLRSAILRTAPHLRDPQFAPLVGTFARINLLALDSYEFLRERGLIGENGELRSSVDTVQRLSSALLKIATALNLTPAAIGKLKGERPTDLASALATHIDEAETVEA